MIGVLLLLAVLAYANAADDHGSAKVGEFWRESSVRGEVLRSDYGPAEQTVRRFGMELGGKQ